MSFKRIGSFISWLLHKWFFNLFRLPLQLHRKCIKDWADNAMIHCIVFGITVAIASVLSVKDSTGNHQVPFYMDIMVYVFFIHFIYCIIRNQYDRYISEMNETLWIG
jgi:hypothetical protein